MITSMIGRFTPLQADVLALGGVVCGVPEDLVTEEDRLKGMQNALKSLRLETEQDFGFAIERWHAFLLSSDAFKDEYKFDYAWHSVQSAISYLLHDQDRIRLVNKLLAGWSSS